MLFAAATIAYFAAMVLEIGVLEPRLFPEAQSRELVMPGPPPAAKGAGREP